MSSMEKMKIFVMHGKIMPSILRYAEFNDMGLPEAIDLSNFFTAWKHAITVYGKHRFIIQYMCISKFFIHVLANY